MRDQDWSRHPAHESLQITPWISDQEWMSVARALLSLKESQWMWAQKAIDRWSHRVERLPMGVEMTAYLLPTLLHIHSWRRSTPDASTLTVQALSMGGALNRVLNVLSHWADRRVQVTHYHDMAALLGIPSWVVDLRHETTHGHMPNREQLIRGLQFCLRWTLANYWQQELDHLGPLGPTRGHIRGTREYEKLHKLLDCWGYLKLYTIWGTKTMGELKEQSDLYRHVTELWHHCQFYKLGSVKRAKISDHFDALGIKEGATRIRDELVRVLSSMDDFNKDFVADAMTTSLMEDELLFPAQATLKSLRDDHGVDDEPADLPPILERQWLEVLELLAQYGFIYDLIVKILAVGSSLAGAKRKLASGWLRLICSERSVTKPTEKKPDKSSKRSKRRKSNKASELEVTVVSQGIISAKNLTSDPRFAALVDQCLMSPNDFVLENLSSIYKLQRPRIEPVLEQKLRQLMRIKLGHLRGGSNLSKDLVVHDWQSIDKSGSHTTEVDSQSTPKWGLASKSVDWSSIPFGLLPGQSLELLTQQILCDRPGEPDSDEESIDLLTGLEDGAESVEVVSKVNWDQIASSGTSATVVPPDPAPPSVPAFYRNSKRKQTR